MAYSANQYNYSTPLSSSTGFTDASTSVVDKKYFTLFDNVLDGSYYPISGDVGLWGNTLATSDGSLPAPFIVTVTEALTLDAVLVAGSSRCYPVDFTLDLYNGSAKVYSEAIVGNTKATRVCVLPRNYAVTHYTISVSRISSGGAVAMLHRSYEAFVVRSVDAISLSQGVAPTSDLSAILNRRDIAPLATNVTRAITNRVSASDSGKLQIVDKTQHIRNSFALSDRVSLKTTELTHITNTIAARAERCAIKLTEAVSHIRNTAEAHDRLILSSAEESVLRNIHTVMKDFSRRIYGKVYITYTDPMRSNETSVESSGTAYNSVLGQILDGTKTASGKYFTLYDNDLTGSYLVSSENSQVGWTSNVLSDANGSFVVPPYVTIRFAARPITQLTLYLDDSHDCLIEDFIVTFGHPDGTETSRTITGNTAAQVELIDTVLTKDAIYIKITALKVSKPFYPATIIDLPVVSTVLYVGYRDTSDLVSIDLLEELTYEDDIEALGGVSANEVTVILDNTDRTFSITNKESPFARQLQRNRKIVPWLGAEIVPGEIEWYTLGTYWSYSWDVPYDSPTASVKAFDTIGLLGTSPFTQHQVLTNISIGDLIDYVMSDAKKTLSFLEWVVADELYDVIIPYAWFQPSNHAAALRRISLCYPMHVYCDRQGRVCAAPQRLRLDYHHDVWANNTNVISKTFSSLHTVVPNVVTVSVINPRIVENDKLVTDSLVLTVNGSLEYTLNFSKPYISNLQLAVDKDDSVSYTYETYSWGIVFKFTGTGEVRSIECTGSALDISNTSTISRRDEESIRNNGMVTRDVSASFIQTHSLATHIIDRLFELSRNDKYDAEVEYRGDIALSINDSIKLLDGIAPDNRYTIKRHQLSWNGGLTGSADLNT